MSKSRSRRTKKHRRKTRAILAFGQKARPVHKSPSGRTGRVRSTQLKEKPRGAPCSTGLAVGQRAQSTSKRAR